MEKRVDLPECEDDAQAIRKAAKSGDGRAMELWNGAKLVKQFKATEPKR